MALLNRNFYLGLIISLIIIGYAAHSDAEESLQLYEQDIKAGLLYNFLKYTQWPQAIPEDSSVTVCIFGNDPIQKHLQPMQERTVNQHSISVRKINSIEETDKCHLLFIGAEQKEQWSILRNSIAGKSILTVSDIDNFSENGGMIEFSKRNNRITAQLNMPTLNKANLRVQDRLLKLVIVIGKR